MVDAYKKGCDRHRRDPREARVPVVAKSIDIAKQAAVLVVSAKSDFTGMSAL